MLPPLSAWKTAWAAIPLDPTGALFASNIANYLLTQSLTLELAPPFFGTVVFTFNSAVFQSGIAGLTASPVAGPGASGVASAFQSAIMASTLIVGPGAYVGAPAPPTLWSAPPVATPNVGLVSAAYASLLSSLTSASNASLQINSAMPGAFYSAFSSIGFDLVGLNSIVPTPTPLVLIAAAVM